MTDLTDLERRLILELGDMITQHCQISKGSSIYPNDGDGAPYYDSMALTANRDAIRLMIELGFMAEVGEGYGRRIVARFTDKWRDL